MVAMRSTCALCPLSASVTRSPTLMQPERRCRRGRGSRGRRAARSAPACGRVRAERVARLECARGARAGADPCTRACARTRRATLSPPTAETGMAIASRKPKRSISSRKSASMARKRLLRPVDEIHLVDGEDDALHADDVEDGRVAPRLPLHAVARVDQHDGDVGVRGARRHVARVLLVAGAVDDDEAARRGVEVAPGDVDGDALLALGDEAVEQQAESRDARRRSPRSTSD